MESIHRRIVFAALMLVFLVIGFFSFQYGANQISNEFFVIAAHDAQNMATMLANDIQLHDDDVKKLKSMSFREMVGSSYNKEFSERVLSYHFSVPPEYVYLAVLLPKNQVRYAVDHETEHFFSAPVGTELEVMWLLDIPLTAKQPDINVDAYRYYPKTDDLARAFHEKKVVRSNVLNDGTEWGNSITGYAPVFSVEGNFIGMLGVDLPDDDYKLHVSKGLNVVWIVLIATNATLLLLMLFFYFKYLRSKQREMYRDPLTNAYNRRFFDDFFVKKLRKDSYGHLALAIMMLDVDHFKQINDTYGHARGDECLKAIAKTIYHSLDNPPNLLIRYGGEEFLLGIAVKDEKEAKELMQRILDQVRALKLFRDERRITISIGACLCEPHKITPHTINSYIQKADENLYQAKAIGRDRYCISTDIK